MKRRFLMLSIIIIGIVCVVSVILIIGFILFSYKNKVVILDAPAVIEYDIDVNEESLILEDIYNIKNVNIRYQVNANIPKRIDGKFSESNIYNQEDALSALLKLRDVYNIKEYDFYCESIEEGVENKVYSLYQLHKGVPVQGGYFRIVTSKEGEAVAIEGEYKDVSQVEVTPQITWEEGYKMLNIKSTTRVISAELVVYALGDDSPVLCWKYVTEDVDPTENKYIFVNAINGEIVQEIPTAYH